MKQEILAHIENPGQLEKLYRSNKTTFKKAFRELYPVLKGSAIADTWHERLHFESDEISWGTQRDLVFVVVAGVLAGLVAKLPHIFNIDEDYFYPRNIGLIVFPFLATYFAWKNQLSVGKVAFAACVAAGGFVFINLLPQNMQSDTLALSCIHLLIVLWGLLAFVYTGNQTNDHVRRLGFLKYNGDLVVMSGLIVIAGGIVSGITIGLFSLIGLNIEEFYFKNVVVFGLAAVPLVATYLTQTNPQLVGKVSPVIAKIFSPVVLVMLVIYLVAIIYSGKNPYNDREFLIMFNALLIGVMALIFFSVAEDSYAKSKAEVWVLLLLSILTIIINGTALSAILFRISEWGITPNRAAVLGSNVLILIHLLLVTVQLIRVASGKNDIAGVGKTIAWYLPVYIGWGAVVTFLFPYIFGFK